jgi:hypothetical protein
MLALATTHEGDVSWFLHALDGTSSETVTLASAVEALHEQVRVLETDPRVCVAESRVSSDAAIRRFAEATILWISRVPETSTEAKTMVDTASQSTDWQDTADGQTHWVTRTLSPAGKGALDHRAPCTGGGSADAGTPHAAGRESRARREAHVLASLHPARCL